MSTSVQKMVRTAMLCAISIILFLPIFEFQVPLMPGFLKIDFSLMPALLATFAMGPVYGMAVVTITNIAHLVLGFSTTGGVGELADFLIGASLVLPAGFVYRKLHTHKGALLGMLAGIIGMIIVGVLANKLILLPLYINQMTEQGVIGYSAQGNSAITSITTLLLYAIAPFNLLKGLLVSLVTWILYKRFPRNVLHAEG